MHRPGEINFWLPLTNAGAGRASLWVEDAPGAGDAGDVDADAGAGASAGASAGPGPHPGFHQLEVVLGEVARFYGVEVRHKAPPNATPFTRVSLDFRCALACCFDAEWRLLRGKGERKVAHEMRTVVVPDTRREVLQTGGGDVD